MREKDVINMRLLAIDKSLFLKRLTNFVFRSDAVADIENKEISYEGTSLESVEYLFNYLYD